MLRKSLTLGRVAALLAFGSGAVLMAQSTDDVDPFMKLHFQAGSKTDQGQRNGFGFGFGANIKVGAGTLGFEASYTTTPGQITRADIPANTLNYNQSNSVITKKHTTELLGARISYGMSINENWAWHIGVGLAHVKDRLETVGDFEGSALSPDGLDGVWNADSEKSSFSAAPFVGLNYKLSSSGSLEFNVIFMNNKRADVTPVFAPSAPAYRRVTPSYGSSSYSDARLEVGYTFHF